MNKEIRDGKVGVIYSPGFGAGWYTWHHVEEMVYDPNIISIIERYTQSEDDRTEMAKEIEEYCTNKYGEDYYYGGADDLIVIWLNEGTKFWINEYDGSESIMTIDNMNWMTA